MFQSEYIADCSADASGKIFATWSAAYPHAGVLVLLPEAEKKQVEQLQAAARVHHINMMGAVFPALLTHEGFLTSGAILILFDPCPTWILVGHLGGNKNSTTLNQLVNHIKFASSGQTTESPPTLFMVLDGMLSNIETILFRIYNKLGNAVRYAGINAGSETFQPMPCLFDQERYLGEGGLAMLLPAEVHFAVEHGYPTAKEIAKATSAEGNRIDKINNRPALEVYKNLVKEAFGIDITSENFYQYAVHYPMGVITALAVLVRIPVGLTPEGSIYCVGEIPINSFVKILRAPDLEQSHCIESLKTQLSDAVSPLLAFYCSGRCMHFGAAAYEELHALQAASLAETIYGALTLGEIGTDPQIGFPQFHNAALVLAWGFS